MDSKEILLLGLGIQPPWQLVDQRLDIDKSPHELHLEVKAERGSKYACPQCGKACSAHAFQEKTWRHLNFFQHHCYVHASVPRVKCPEHGVKLATVAASQKVGIVGVVTHPLNTGVRRYYQKWGFESLPGDTDGALFVRIKDLVASGFGI